MKPNTLRGNVWIIRNPIPPPVRNPVMSYPAADRLKIAVLGSGVAALSSAWLLSQRHRVTVYEKADDRAATPEPSTAIFKRSAAG